MILLKVLVDISETINHVSLLEYYVPRLASLEFFIGTYVA